MKRRRAASFPPLAAPSAELVVDMDVEMVEPAEELGDLSADFAVEYERARKEGKLWQYYHPAAGSS